jgi:hypothetical protein
MIKIEQSCKITCDLCSEVIYDGPWKGRDSGGSYENLNKLSVGAVLHGVQLLDDRAQKQHLCDGCAVDVEAGLCTLLNVTPRDGGYGVIRVTLTRKDKKE